MAGAKAATSGPNTTSAQSVRIQLQGDQDEEEERRKRDQEAEEKRAQNQLPSWIANSTISGEASSRQLELQAKQAAASGHSAFSSSNLNPATALDVKPDTLLTAAAAAPEDDLESYYASLAAEGQSVVEPTLAASSSARSPGPSSVGTPADASNFDQDEVAAEIELAWHNKRPRSDAESASLVSGGKRARASSVDSTSLAAGSVAASDAGDELDDAEFEDEEEDDPNPLIQIGDRKVPFLEIDEAMTQIMSADEYTKYFDVFARIG